MTHETVLLEQAVAALVIEPAGLYIDATFGRGGHARAVLAQLGTGGRLLALDRDPDAVSQAALLAHDPRFEIVRSPFSRLRQLADERGWTGRVSGVLMDLGVSSPQLDDPARGFSFLRDGPLDMRMDPAVGASAAEWLASAAEDEIARVLKDFGEERYARRIARALVRERVAEPITRTARLAEIVAAAHPRWEQHKHPATRSFQAIRIFINRELEELGQALAQVVDVLAVGGRLVVISFHSLEDRLVKHFIRRQHRGEPVPASIPLRHVDVQGRLEPVGKAIKPDMDEIAANPRSRSAVMRIARKLR